MTHSKQSKEQQRIRKLEFLAEVACLYYEHEFTQAEIAEKLFISRSRISRLLKLAREKGIVKISVNHMGERSFELEQMLKRKFNLKDAIVLNNSNLDYQNVLKHMGILTAQYLKEHLRKGQVIGISWGRSIAKVVEAMEADRSLKPRVVQIIGGVLIQNPVVDISGLTHKIITKLDATGIYLNAPLFVNSETTSENLRKQPVIAYALEIARNADIIMTGIGDVAEDTLSTMWSGYDNRSEIDELVKSGAVGFICARAYDINGNKITTGFNERVIGISLEDLKKAKTVIAISGGKRKAKAVLGALRGGYMNVLVTDQNCVHEMIKIE